MATSWKSLEGHVRDWIERKVACGVPEIDCSLPFLNNAPKMVECHECHRIVYPSEEIRCSRIGCLEAYHKSCVKSKNGIFKCPRHACFFCKQKFPLILHCVRCTRASHMKCAPWGNDMIQLENRHSRTICWRHPIDWRLDKEHANPTRDMEEAFSRLPLPYVDEEFHFGSIKKVVMKNKMEPAPYNNIKRNIYLVKKKRDGTEARLGCTNCKANSTCSEKCECRGLSISCSKACHCSDMCKNRPFCKEKKIKIVRTTHDDGKKNIVFTFEMDDELLDCFQEQCNLGRRCDRGFKMEAYTAVARAMTASTNNTYEFNQTQIKNRVKHLKREFAVVSDLLNASGFGFDNVTKRVTAPPDVWQSWLEGHPSHNPWKKKIINYTKMTQVFGKDTATGVFASGIDDIELDDMFDEAAQSADNIGESSGTSGTKRKSRISNADIVECIRESSKSLEAAIEKVGTLISTDPKKKLAEDIYVELKNILVLNDEDIEMCQEYLLNNPTKAHMFLTAGDKIAWLQRRYQLIKDWSDA